VLLGDERDGPRGRIVMMQKMLEESGTPSAETVLHVDRCLSCLACRTACPSSVDYARLVDLSRAYIEKNFRRPFGERVLRRLIVETMSRPSLVRAGLALARGLKPVVALLPGTLGAMGRKGARIRARTAPSRTASVASTSEAIAMIEGCVQAAIAPEIDTAFAHLAMLGGRRVVSIEGCCGALAHHLGQEDKARKHAMHVIDAFETASRADGVDTITISATGCAAHLKDYPHLFRDGAWRERAAAFAKHFRDVSELMTPTHVAVRRQLRVAFHSACSAQNGLRLKGKVEALLTAAGFEVVAIPEGHLCCGSAGSYSLLQPDIAGALRARKLENIQLTAPDVVATGNIGCLLHLSGPDAPPIVHYVELLDWAQGGAIPNALVGKVEATVAPR
jgi:glycolate oxidase iron-sulfur subunit